MASILSQALSSRVGEGLQTDLSGLTLTCPLCTTRQEVILSTASSDLDQAICIRCKANLVLVNHKHAAYAARASGKTTATSPLKRETSSITRRQWLLGLSAAIVMGIVNFAILASLAHLAFSEIKKRYNPYDVDEHVVTPLILKAMGWTDLHLAAARGQVLEVKRLLDYRADINAKNPKGQTAFYESAKRGRLAVVQLLIERGGVVDAKEGEVGFTALHVAAEKHHIDVAKFLLANGADVNSKNYWKQTPLHQAAWQTWHEDSEVARVLIDHGADLEVKDNKGFTSLLTAASNGHTLFVQLLLAKGANLHARTHEESTALYLAADNGHAEIVETLLHAGATANAKTKGRTALRAAVEDNNVKLAELLLENGAEVNLSLEGWTPLDSAEAWKHQEIAAVLRQYGGRSFKEARDHCIKGFEFDEHGQHDRAIAEYDRAIAIDPNYELAIDNRGVVYGKKGLHDQALADFKRAIEVDPSRMSPYKNLDWILAQRGAWDEIISYWSRLIELQPTNGKAYLERGGSYFHKGDRENALKDAQTACSLGDQEGCRIYTTYSGQGKS